jgi:hypothetical protein
VWVRVGKPFGERIEQDRARVLDADIESLAAAVPARIDPNRVPPMGTDARPLIEEVIPGLYLEPLMPEIVRPGLLDDREPALDRLHARIMEGINAMRRTNEARATTARHGASPAATPRVQTPTVAPPAEAPV